MKHLILLTLIVFSSVGCDQILTDNLDRRFKAAGLSKSESKKPNPAFEACRKTLTEEIMVKETAKLNIKPINPQLFELDIFVRLAVAVKLCAHTVKGGDIGAAILIDELKKFHESKARQDALEASLIPTK